MSYQWDWAKINKCCISCAGPVTRELDIKRHQWLRDALTFLSLYYTDPQYSLSDPRWNDLLSRMMNAINHASLHLHHSLLLPFIDSAKRFLSICAVSRNTAAALFPELRQTLIDLADRLTVTLMLQCKSVRLSVVCLSVKYVLWLNGAS